MVEILLACGAVCSWRMKKRYEARREDEKEYASRFEEFKAENQRWEARRQSYRTGQDELTGTPDTEHPANHHAGSVSVEKPPSYDMANETANMESSRTNPATSRSTSWDSVFSDESRADRSSRPIIERTVAVRESSIGARHRVETREVSHW